jgi:hypothetical protein
MERARREIGAVRPDDTANTAKRLLTAVMAVVDPTGAVESHRSNGSNGSTEPWPAVDWDAVREAFEERAAIMEFDGGLACEEAEQAAWAIVGRGRVGPNREQGVMKVSELQAPQMQAAAPAERASMRVYGCQFAK